MTDPIPFQKDFVIAGDGDDGDTDIYYMKKEDLQKFKVEKPWGPEYDAVAKMLELGVILAAVPGIDKSDEVTLPFVVCYLVNITALKKHTAFEDEGAATQWKDDKPEK